MYDPALGRFHTIDPISPFFPGISPYNYANDNPVYFRDEYGLGIGDFLNKLKDFALTTIGFTRHGTVVAKNNYYTWDRKSKSAKRNRGSNSQASSSQVPSGGSSSNNYTINFKESPNDNVISSFPHDAVKPLEIGSIVSDKPASSNSISWNNRLIDVAGQVDLQLDRDLFQGDSDAFNDNLALEIENLYSISEYLANHPEFTVTIIVSTPKLAGTVENCVFDNQRSMEEFKRTVGNRAVRIAELIRIAYPSIKRSQINTKTVTGKKIIKLRLSH